MGRATVRISLKTIAMMFPAGSAEQVYLHGKWQIEQGRNPSMWFGNHGTPRESYKAVDHMLGTYFDEIRRQHCSRSAFFWSREWNPTMITDIQNRVPVCELPLIGPYR